MLVRTENWEVVLMRIVIFSTCPGGVYSGGRYHALIAGYCLARRGHQVYFVTDNEPVFDTDLRPISPENPVKIVLTKDFEVVSDLRFDHVIIAPQSTKYRRLYMNAIRLAESNQAALSFFCFEAANWFNEISPVKRPLFSWSEWHLPVARGALILCSASESERYARSYFTDLHPETAFGVWKPAINQVARDAAAPSEAQGDILIFARPMDAHKGSDVVEQLLVPELKDHRIVVVIGNPRGAEDYRARLETLAGQRGNKISFSFGLSDVEKFEALNRASALVFPSFFEGYGYPPIEALATDTHCIAYDLPVIRENCGDLVRYVPPGDVAALRCELIAALQSPVPRTSTLEAVRFLSDIDIRAQALEDALETYRTQRNARQMPSASALAKRRCNISLPQQVRLGDRVLIHFMISMSYRISSAVFSDGKSRSCCVIPSIAVKGGILHHMLIDLPMENGNLPEWLGGQLFLTFHGHAGATIDLPASFEDCGKSLPFDSSSAGVTQVFDAPKSVVLFSWALPAQEYDAAIWATSGQDGMLYIPGDVGLVTSGHRTRTGLNQGVSCGISFYMPENRPLGTTNHLLLLRNGSIVFSCEIPQEEMASAARKTATSIEQTSGDLLPQRNQFRALARYSSNRGQIVGWTDAIENVVQIELRKKAVGSDKPQVLARLAPNVIRPDVAKQYRLSRDKLGFCLMLPPSENRSECSVAFKSQGEQIGIVDWIKSDTDTISLPSLKTGPLVVSLTDEMKGGSVAIIRRPPKQAITKFIYDAAKGTLLLQGWILAKGTVTVKIVRADTYEEIGTLGKLIERADVAKKFGSQYLESGIDFEIGVVSLSKAGYLLRVTVDKVVFEADQLPPPQLSNVKEFRVADCRYDPKWPALWVRGSFVCPEVRLAGIEIRQGGRILCTGAVNIKQLRHGDPLAGWRVESVLDQPIDPNQPLEVRGITHERAVASIRFVPNEVTKAPAVANIDEAVARLGLAGAFHKHVAPAGLEAGHTVLLVVHNLDAVDRPEKLNALVSLRAALLVEGLQLVVFHHCKNRVSGDLPEINFFDPFFDLVRQIEGADLGKAVRSVLPQESMSGIVGALYGFISSQNMSPPSWKDCTDQIEEEAQRLYYVLRALNPRHVLLWHQWNSLMDIGRNLCQGMGLTSAYLHEGMLPKTMTYDPKGMMADAECVGVTMQVDSDGPTPEQALWLNRAEAVITTIREDGLDRKPLSGLRVGNDLRRIADSMGARLIFYAGINDWHSGNLPEAGGAIHSPFFRDTLDGLDALLEIAEENNWLIMFKPHPNLYPRPIAPHPRLFVVRESNTLDCIDVSDVVATILSSICYISLSRRKATILLGRNTLTGTGSAYEIDDRGKLAIVVAQALETTDTPLRFAAFRNHVAALLRDYLYSYDPADTLAILSHVDLIKRLLRDIPKMSTGSPVVELASEASAEQPAIDLSAPPARSKRKLVRHEAS